MKSINEYNKKGMGEILKNNVTAPWYFDKWYEKLIMLVLCGLGVIKIIGWLF
jgi:hypothetical protein